MAGFNNQMPKQYRTPEKLGPPKHFYKRRDRCPQIIRSNMFTMVDGGCKPCVCDLPLKRCCVRTAGDTLTAVHPGHYNMPVGKLIETSNMA